MTRRTGRYAARPVLPGILIVVGAAIAALAGPGWMGAPLAFGGALALIARGGATAARAVGWTTVGLVVATLLGQSLLLSLGVGVDWSVAWNTAAVFAVRLGGFLVVGMAFAVLVPARDWLVSLRHWPRVALVMMLTFRQVPELAEDAARIRRGQRARGLLVGRAGGTRARSLTVPLVTRALERADRMGRTLALAGWDSTSVAATVRVVQVRWRPADAVLAVAGVLLAVSVWFF